MLLSSGSISDLYTSLSTSEKGLSSKNAAKRISLQRKQFNKETRLHRELKLFIGQFSNPLILMLAIVLVLAVLLNQRSDALIISLIIFVTGILGFIQEIKAGRASEKLLQLIEIRHQVIREGKLTEVNTEEVVPGDILLLNAGDIIPADCRIIESNELHVDESSLTGESFPVEKNVGELPEETKLSDKSNCLWQGTSVVTGTARALAVVTGNNTIFGEITKNLQFVSETAFEIGIKRFGYFLLRVTILLSVFILLTNLYFQKPFFNSLLFSLALAIGMAPELLPAIMTFTMSVGAKRMMEKKVIVKKLSAIFSFGEVNVFCTDKTGTITEGTVNVFDIVNVSGQPDEWVKLCSFLNSSFQSGFSNPIDTIIKSLPCNINGYSKTDEIPYDFIRKRLSIAVENNNKYLLITKGAVPFVLNVCTCFRNEKGQKQAMLEADLTRFKSQFSSYSNDGLRVLGVCTKELTGKDAHRNDECEMEFLGFILLQDPLKESAGSSIKRLQDLDVTVKILTGDNRFSAMHAAKGIGIINPQLITGEDLAAMSPEALVVKAPETDVFAEIEPHEKERIVKALQKRGFVVAYLGDGINDVSAIHLADIGISTSNATDVAKEAADFVLLEKDLAVLANGIHEGRKSFTNSMKYVFATTGSTFGNMFSVAIASLILSFLPMLPQQILFANLITDLPFLAIASDEVEDADVKRPLKWNIGLIRRFMIVFGLHSSLFDFITFYTLLQVFNLRNSDFQSGWFMESVVTELLIILIIRSRKSILKSKPGKVLLTAVVLAVVVTVLLPLSPLADSLGLAKIQPAVSLTLTGIILAYLLSAELLKKWLFSF